MAVPRWLTITGETVVRKHHKFTGGTFLIIRPSPVCDALEDGCSTGREGAPSATSSGIHPCNPDSSHHLYLKNTHCFKGGSSYEDSSSS
jgi:hypothetical protein